MDSGYGAMESMRGGFADKAIKAGSQGAPPAAGLRLHVRAELRGPVRSHLGGVWDGPDTCTEGIGEPARACHCQRKEASENRTMSEVLKGKVALVAGATRGAGRGIAVELGAAGLRSMPPAEPPASTLRV